MSQQQDPFIDMIARSAEEIAPPAGWQDEVRQQIRHARAHTAARPDTRKPWWFTAGISGGLVAVVALAISLFVIRGIEDEREFAAKSQVASLAAEHYVANLKRIALQSKSLQDQLNLEIREIDALQARYEALMDEISADAIASRELLEEAEMIKATLQAKRAEMMRLRSKAVAHAKATAKAKAKKRAERKKYNKCAASADPLCGL